jgi:hypothetical protein
MDSLKRISGVFLFLSGMVFLLPSGSYELAFVLGCLSGVFYGVSKGIESEREAI